MATYTITFRTSTSDGTEITGEFPELQSQLAEAGYEGPSIRVTSDNGETRGWVSAEGWRAE